MVIHTFPLQLPANVASQGGVVIVVRTHTGTNHCVFFSVGTRRKKAPSSFFLRSPSLPCSPPFLLQSCMCPLTVTEERLLLLRQYLVTETKAVTKQNRETLFLSRLARKMSVTLLSSLGIDDCGDSTAWGRVSRGRIQQEVRERGEREMGLGKGN